MASATSVTFIVSATDVDANDSPSVELVCALLGAKVGCGVGTVDAASCVPAVVSAVVGNDNTAVVYVSVVDGKDDASCVSVVAYADVGAMPACCTPPPPTTTCLGLCNETSSSINNTPYVTSTPIRYVDVNLPRQYMGAPSHSSTILLRGGVYVAPMPFAQANKIRLNPR